MRPVSGPRTDIMNDRHMPVEFKMILLSLYGKCLGEIFEVRIIDSISNSILLEENKTISLARAEKNEIVISMSSPSGKTVIVFETSFDIGKIEKKFEKIFFTRRYQISVQPYLQVVPDIPQSPISVQG